MKDFEHPPSGKEDESEDDLFDEADFDEDFDDDYEEDEEVDEDDEGEVELEDSGANEDCNSKNLRADPPSADSSSDED